MSKIKCKFKINGLTKEVNIHDDKTLIFVIRDDFKLTGTKLGCGLEQCGSCAVLIDGKKKLSCNVIASDFQDCEITTIEGLSNDKGLNIVQKAFKNHNAAQCGYCTSGIIISLSELFKNEKNFYHYFFNWCFFFRSSLCRIWWSLDWWYKRRCYFLVKKN